MIGFKRKKPKNHEDNGWISLPVPTNHSLEQHTKTPKQHPPQLREKIIKTTTRTIGPSTASILQEIEETEAMANPMQTSKTSNPSIPPPQKPRLSPTVTSTTTKIEGFRGFKPTPYQPISILQSPTRHPTSRPPTTLNQGSTPFKKWKDETSNPHTANLRLSKTTTDQNYSRINPQHASPQSFKKNDWFHRILNVSRIWISWCLQPFSKQRQQNQQDPEDSFVNLPFMEEKSDIRPGVHTLKIEEGNDIYEALGILRSKPAVLLLDISAIRHNTELLQRIIKKIKHTQGAISGDLVGFGDSWIIATTQGISVERGAIHAKPKNPYTHQTTAKPSMMNWEQFESWNQERKLGREIKLERY